MRKKIAFTLTEIVVVILVITMVISITIKGTKTRLDSITSINYYTAYNLLTAVTSKMILDFRPETKWGFTYNTERSILKCGVGDPETGETGKGEDTELVEVHCDNPEGEYVDSICDPLICKPKTISLPRSGELLCKKLGEILNIDPAFESSNDFCAGTSIDNDTLEFADEAPSLKLRNGMLIYNANTDANYGSGGQLPMLKGNFQREEFDGVPNTNEYGYVVYVDIDGTKNDSILWEDVFPFYLTFSGTVIPGYNSAAPAGGNNTFHLQASIADETIRDGVRSNNWIAKNVDFREAACSSGFISGETDYCKNASITQNTDCADANHDCQLKINKPMRWLK